MDIIDVQMPEVSVYCPKCDDELSISGDEFERYGDKHHAIATTYCDECDYLFAIGLV